MDDSKISKKEMGEAEDVQMDDFLRTLLGQMFENDNDTTYLRAKLKATDGSISELEFMIRITAVDGISTRDEDDDNG
jgi:hypothetical protein